MTICQLQPTNMPALVAQLLGVELLQKVRRLARQVGYRRPEALTPAELRAPDTPIAKKARQLVEELSTPALANHCHRSFVFALAIGSHRKMQFDRELLYIAIMMHDLGLTDAHLGPEPFETRGANAARKFCVTNGVDEARADRVHEAITIHTSVKAAFEPPQIALVQLGAGADLIGYYIEDVAAETIAYAAQTHPRLGVKPEIVRLLKREAKQNPDMVVAAQMRLGFARRIQHAPFPD